MARRTRAGLIVVWLVVVVASLIWHTPIAWLAQQAGSSAPGWVFSGRLSAGQVSGQFNQQPLTMSWRATLWPLLLLRAQADLQLQGTWAITATGWRGLGGGWQVRIPNLSLPAGTWPGLPPGISMPAWSTSDVALVVRRSGSGAWRAASGELTTPGGPLTLTLQGQPLVVTLPPALIRLATESEDLVVTLTEQSGGLLGRFSLTSDQRATWQLTERLMRLRPGHRAGPDPDRIVLTVTEPWS